MFDPKALNSPTIQTNKIYNKLGNRDHSASEKNPAQNYDNNMDIQFRAQNMDDESGVCSPPLWKPSTSRNHGNLSPKSRTKAIAKGQRELMEIAKKLPESCYELSLRDMVESPIVESPKLVDDEERCLVNEKKIEKMKSVKENVKRQESKKVGRGMERVKSGNYENGGLFLKMVFPISIRSKRKKISAMSNSNSKRVSPKVETLGNSLSGKEWWKKRFSGSSGSEESCVTNTSNGSCKSTNIRGNRKVNGCSGCWSFALSRKHKRKSK